MAMIFLKSTTTFLLFFSALSIAIAEVVDIDGDPLSYGRPYYIIPLRPGLVEGLSLTPKTTISSQCPLYITLNTDETSHGIPVTITTSPPSDEKSPIQPGSPISIVFQDTPNICMQPLGWKVISDQQTGQHYVATGGSGVAFNPYETFIIEDFVENVYKIKNIAFPSTNVGIFEKDGLMGISDENPLHVAFKKAFKVLAMKV